MKLSANEYSSVSQLAADAIEASIVRNTKVGIEAGSMSQDALESELEARCTAMRRDIDYCDFWGEDPDGEIWLVIVTYGPDCSSL
jgi:hypothetical protein